jgi:putative DNA primase/helicase
MANGLGGDLESFETDPDKLAEAILWRQEAERLRRENARLRQQLPQMGDGSAGFVEIVNGAAVTPAPITWQWDGWLAAGKLHILAGAKGTLKTTLAIDWAARITSGGLWPDGTRAPNGHVLIWSGEDDFDDTLLPRFLGAGGEAERFHYVKGTTANGRQRPFDPARDMPGLMESAQAISNLQMMIVDPIVSAVAGDSHKNAEVRRGLQPLVGFIAGKKCSGLGLTHFTKGTVGRDPVERVTGSLAFGALARIVLVTAKPVATEGQKKIGAGGEQHRPRRQRFRIYRVSSSSHRIQFCCTADLVGRSARRHSTRPAE